MSRFSVSDRYYLWSVVLSDLYYIHGGQGDSIACAPLCFSYHLHQPSRKLGTQNILGRLLNNINCVVHDRPYSNSVTILQTSGTGKSCMVHELSDLVFTLPFNLHLDYENNGYSSFQCICNVFLHTIIRYRVSSPGWRNMWSSLLRIITLANARPPTCFFWGTFFEPFRKNWTVCVVANYPHTQR